MGPSGATVGHMATAAPGCCPRNSTWASASKRPPSLTATRASPPSHSPGRPLRRSALAALRYLLAISPFCFPSCCPAKANEGAMAQPCTAAFPHPPPVQSSLRATAMRAATLSNAKSLAQRGSPASSCSPSASRIRSRASRTTCVTAGASPPPCRRRPRRVRALEAHISSSCSRVWVSSRRGKCQQLRKQQARRAQEAAGQ